MEYSPRWTRQQQDQQHSAQLDRMSILAMAAPLPHAHFQRELPWENSRPTFDYGPSRPRSDTQRIALPSIHQAFPEIHLRIGQREGASNTPSSSTSPVAALAPPGLLTPPEYAHSPSRKRRRSFSAERDERPSQIPRLSNSSPRNSERSLPRGGSPYEAARLAPIETHSAPRTSPYVSTGGLPPTHSPTSTSWSDRYDSRPPPAAAASAYQPSHAPTQSPMLPHELHYTPPSRVRSTDDYSVDDRRSARMHYPRMEQGSESFRGYTYSQPSRLPTLSGVHPLDRTPFSAHAYGSSYHDYMRMHEMGHMGMDSKQRKRRGNLPKDTTDKLRAWFLGHLHHPYPTEDEKQELMRQTGLQMNQISNWFINARRRQLPAMISDARAQSDAINSHVRRDFVDAGKPISSTERSEYHHMNGSKHRDSPVSDGGDSPFDSDIESRRRSANMNRGSV